MLLERAGRMPLPPYIAGKRPTDAQDRSDYQTMFADKDGAVAAPTAALHFTPELMGALGAAGIGHETLTLHVGAGTFLPVKAEDTAEHAMHAEWGQIDAATAERLNAVRAGGGRVIAVGTTSLRLLESAADDDGVIRSFAGDTAIFITPGYRFKAIDGLLTNFHLPKSTLFMLVSALIGLERMQAAYAHAIATDYRFYSYGDASLLAAGLNAEQRARIDHLVDQGVIVGQLPIEHQHREPVDQRPGLNHQLLCLLGISRDLRRIALQHPRGGAVVPRRHWFRGRHGRRPPGTSRVGERQADIGAAGRGKAVVLPAAASQRGLLERGQPLNPGARERSEQRAPCRGNGDRLPSPKPLLRGPVGATKFRRSSCVSRCSQPGLQQRRTQIAMVVGPASGIEVDTVSIDPMFTA